MKRWALRICLFLLLGAIVNVAVAWGLAQFLALDWRLSNGTRYDHFTAWGSDYWPDNPEPPRFPGYTANRWTRKGALRVSVSYSSWFSGAAGRSTHEFEDLLPEWAYGFLDIPELVGREREFPDDVALHSSLVDARGWPCLSLWGGMKLPSGVTWTVDGQPVTLVARRYWVLPLNSDRTRGAFTDYRWLPLRPIWPGFAINTVFYAVILWMLFAVPFALRRRLRIKRGLCPACGYQVGTSAVCTECGTPVKPKASAA